MNERPFEGKNESFPQASPSVLLIIALVVVVLVAGGLAVLNESRSPGFYN